MPLCIAYISDRDRAALPIGGGQGKGGNGALDADGARQLVLRRRPDIEHPMVRRLPGLAASPDDAAATGGGATALWLGDAESTIAVGG